MPANQVPSDPVLDAFHPAVAAWFRASFPTPTAAQVSAWPSIRAGQHTLVAAPTGSGKTLTAFLAAIDELVRAGVATGGALPEATSVVYVSPLKALSNDIHINLEAPLEGIRAELEKLGLPDVAIRTAVRTGDTPQSERALLRKQPSHILVTTPESLYVLLGSESGRSMLGDVHTVIVDEIHAIADSKRGSHLALSLERLESLCQRRLLRIGLSATQKPIEEVARFLVGAQQHAGLPQLGKADATTEDDTPADCRIVDVGHARARDLALELPPVPLEAVMSNDAWELVYDRVAKLVRAHRTTLVFVNTRRMAERVARHLSERLGKETVAAHHGSLAKEQRLDAEQRLKRGELSVLVATASLELGIDIGDVELVCQLGSPRSIAAFLQRAGRAGHAVDGTPKARLFPATRDDLVECAALLDCVRRGELDALVIPPQPIDVLAQQLVAEVACQEWDEDALFDLVRRAHPYRRLRRESFDTVVRMLAEGFSTRLGARGAYVHRDAVHRQLRGRRGARLTAMTSGGTIPDTADYKVVLEPQATLIGTVHEDFAVESLAGDVFQLGNASYRILRVERDRVRVEDARGAPPNIPFWLGEAPGRSDELSLGVSRLREEVAQRLDEGGLPAALRWLRGELGLDESAAQQLADYLARAKAALGVLPTQATLVFERFFDESGGTQLVIHTPYGSRINRAWGLALRKRFCRQFNFELQAAATEDAIVLSLSTSHSFPLEEVARYLHSGSAEHVLVQALLDAPLFPTRWRWNATTALALPRFQGGRKVPPQLQRMKSEDLLATVFPDQVACLENIVGEREIPDHPLVAQTLHDCLREAMDVDGLLRILHGLENGSIEVVARDLAAPSPFAAEVLGAAPYAFLDDAPLEERRTLAVQNRRWGDPQSADDLGRLDQAAIDAVREEAWPQVRSADEMHDALGVLGFVTATEAVANHGWDERLQALARDRRATRLTLVAVDGKPALDVWTSAENLPMWQAMHAGAAMQPSIDAPAEHAARTWSREDALLELLRGRLGALGPSTATALAGTLAIEPAEVDATLLRLQTQGYVMQGRFSSETTRVEQHERHGAEAGSVGWSERSDTHATGAKAPVEWCEHHGAKEPIEWCEHHKAETNPIEWCEHHIAKEPVEWCERHLLARIHRYTLGRLRREIEPVSRRDLMRFLFDWQHVAPGARLRGPDALEATLAQLEGYEAAAGAWEAEILPARIEDYAIHWLDDLCRAGRVVWHRLRQGGGGNGPVRATPIVLLPRRSLAVWSALAAGEAPQPALLSSRAQAVADVLQAQGALFFDELLSAARLLRTELEDALGELVAAGRISADSFGGLRALLLPAAKRDGLRHRRLQRHRLNGIEDAGRWALTRAPVATDAEPDAEALEHVARSLLRRYGVVFWKLLEREAPWLPSWRELLRVYRRLEARGEIRGGRFVEGLVGEQFALPEAVAQLRSVRQRPHDGQRVLLSGCDPLNLVGTVLAGDKLPALVGTRILYEDGVAVAALVANKPQWLVEPDNDQQQPWRNALLRRSEPTAHQALG